MFSQFFLLSCLLTNITDGKRTSKISERIQDAEISESLTSENLESKTSSCKDYCVQCNNGDAVWYGRGKNWAKAGAILTLSTVGIATGVAGVAAAATAAGAALAVGLVSNVSKVEEQTSHWSGKLPTTGLSCEQLNVIAFKRVTETSTDCKPEPFMEASGATFGRVKNNMLKPYHTSGPMRHSLMKDYEELDMMRYKNGCKTVKASGLAGALKQHRTVGDWFHSKNKNCEHPVAQAVMICSEHSMLCGSEGVKGIAEGVENADKCAEVCTQTTAVEKFCDAPEPQSNTPEEDKVYTAAPTPAP